MTAVLLTLTELKRFIPDATETDGPLLQDLLNGVEDLLVRECGRQHRPFARAQAARVEVLSGTGTERLYLDYAIDTLTSITLGRDSAAPDETLDIADLDVLIYEQGKRLVERVDCGIFGCANSPRYVYVTYNAQADLPESAKVAIKSVVAAVFRRKGSEGAASEQADGFYSATYADIAKSDPLWAMAVGEFMDYGFAR